MKNEMKKWGSYNAGWIGCYQTGEKVKQFRESKGMTQQSLAEKLYVTRQAVSRWESGGGIWLEITLSVYWLGKASMIFLPGYQAYIRNEKRGCLYEVSAFFFAFCFYFPEALHRYALGMLRI